MDPAVWQDERNIENLSAVAWESATIPVESPSVLARESSASTLNPIPCTSRPYVGASHGSPAGILQQRPGTRRMRPARPTWNPPAPPQGDGSGIYSRTSSSNSLLEFDLQNDFHGRTQSHSREVSPHEEVANEEPLAQLPVRVWLRSGRSNHDNSSVRDGRRSRSSMEAVHGIPAESAHGDGVNQVLPPLEWSSSWQVADELGHTGGMAAPRYLLVRLGECIPAETGAAPVHLSRLDTGPQWRDFLNYGESRDPRGCLALDDLLACPCCFVIFRQPVALTCGHSLCRSCFARISSQPPHMRRCPLCRADFPQCDLKVNLALSAVCDSLRAFRALQAATRGSAMVEIEGELSLEDRRDHSGSPEALSSSQELSDDARQPAGASDEDYADLLPEVSDEIPTAVHGDFTRLVSTRTPPRTPRHGELTSSLSDRAPLSGRAPEICLGRSEEPDVSSMPLLTPSRSDSRIVEPQTPRRQESIASVEPFSPGKESHIIESVDDASAVADIDQGYPSRVDVDGEQATPVLAPEIPLVTESVGDLTLEPVSMPVSIPDIDSVSPVVDDEYLAVSVLVGGDQNAASSSREVAEAGLTTNEAHLFSDETPSRPLCHQE